VREVKAGEAKCWLVHRKAGVLAICIPKVARLNLRIEPGQRFRVLVDREKRRLIYEKLG